MIAQAARATRQPLQAFADESITERNFRRDFLLRVWLSSLSRKLEMSIGAYSSSVGAV